MKSDRFESLKQQVMSVREARKITDPVSDTAAHKAAVSIMNYPPGAFPRGGVDRATAHGYASELLALLGAEEPPPGALPGEAPDEDEEPTGDA